MSEPTISGQIQYLSEVKSKYDLWASKEGTLSKAKWYHKVIHYVNNLLVTNGVKISSLDERIVQALPIALKEQIKTADDISNPKIWAAAIKILSITSGSAAKIATATGVVLPSKSQLQANSETNPVNSMAVVEDFLSSIKGKASDAKIYVKVVTNNSEPIVAEFSHVDNYFSPNYIYLKDSRKNIEISTVRSLEILPRIGNLISTQEKEKLAQIGVRFDDKGFMVETPKENVNCKITVSGNSYHVDISSKEEDESIVSINAKITSYDTRCIIHWSSKQKPIKDLHSIAQKGNITSLKKALAARTDELNNVDKDGRTPLHAAIESGNYEAVQLLLQNGADVKAVTNDKRNVIRHLFWSLAAYNPRDKTILKNYEQMLRLFIEKGIDPNIPYEFPPLHIAANHGRANLLELLLEYKVDINQQSDDSHGRRTALHEAIESIRYDLSFPKNLETIQVLINHGADVHIKDANGITPSDLAKKLGIDLPEKKSSEKG